MKYKLGKRSTRALSSKFINRKILNSKRSQLQISFGMIFSIILIIAFIAVAFYVIKVFLGFKKCTETGLFKQDLQETIERAWSNQEYEDVFSSNLPASLTHVCFVDLTAESKGEYSEYYDKLKKYGYVKVNMFFWPLKKACEGQRAFMLNHINITYITKQKNPYCIKSENGKIELRIEKSFDDILVKIS